MPRRRAFVLSLLLCAAPAALAAQDCEFIRSGITSRANYGTPHEVVSVTEPVVHCEGGRKIIADHATLSQASGQLSLYGNVQFEDSARSLRSMNATYYSKQRRLTASGSVVMAHRVTNSVIYGDQIEYVEAMEGRESFLQAMGQRPRAVMRREAEPDSTILEARLIEIFGEDRLRGTTDAQLTRDSLRAIAQDIEYSQTQRVLQVTGLGARVEIPRYTLIGDSITAQLGEDDQIQDVLTRHDAKLNSEDMKLTAQAAKLFFADGGVTRLVAMEWQPKPGAPPPPQAHVENSEFRMDADSLDVLAPERRITEAVAIGSAYGERVTPDSMKPLLPDAEPEVMRLIAHDWMRGDTVRAFFTENTKAAQDTAAADRVMERLLAVGAPAQSMYRVRNTDAPAAKLSINYLVGKAIEVRFVDGQVTEVFSPDAVGVFLEPADAARRASGTGNGRGSPPRQR